MRNSLGQTTEYDGGKIALAGAMRANSVSGCVDCGTGVVYSRSASALGEVASEAAFG
jgi:hypothetical protein